MNKPNVRNILVTGGAGFIGSNFIRLVLARRPEVNVVNLDALTYSGSLENLRELPDPQRHTFIQGNICDRGLVDRLLREHAIDTIVHFAAESHVDRSIISPGHFIQTNIIGTFTLLEAARHAWLSENRHPPDKVHFHHVSTDEVFGSLSLPGPAFHEDTPYSPNSPYAASKASSNHLVRAYYRTYNLPVTITNCSNNYGPYQFPEKLIPLMILNAMQGKRLPVYGDGKQIRDWLYVEDHCEAILAVLERGRIGETYNIGGNNQTLNIEIVKALCAILDELLPDSPYIPHENLITYVADRPGHDRRYAMNTDKIERELGWKPKESLQTGLEKIVRWYLAHQDWVVAIQQTSNYQVWITSNYDWRGGQQVP